MLYFVGQYGVVLGFSENKRLPYPNNRLSYEAAGTVIEACIEQCVGRLSPRYIKVLERVPLYFFLVEQIAEMHLMSIGLDGERECAFTAIFQAIS